jgi:nicotinamidase-related amidase
MATTTPGNAALVVIDAQQEYFAPLGKVVLPGGPAAVRQIARALAWAGAGGVPIVHVVHESRRPNAATFAPGSPALEIHPEARPLAGEPVLTKHLPGSFTGTALESLLRERGIERLVVTGFMTQMCVDTTARQAAHLGFQVTVLADACAAKAVTAPDGGAIDAEHVHRTHLGSLQGFLAEIKRVDEVTG